MNDDDRVKDSIEDFEKALDDMEGRKYMLRLFVSGMTPRSLQAIENIKAICQEHLRGRFELEVIDIYQQPEALKEEQVIAIPTLIKKLPLPLKRFIGDLSDKDKILVGMDVLSKQNASTKS